MIRRSPAEVYLKYMLLHPKGFSKRDILEACEYAQLDALGESYLERLRKNLKPPPEFYPFDEFHWPSQRFLLEEGLQPIFLPDKRGRKAFEILRKPRAKEFIEAMALLNAPLPSVARIVTREKGVDCTAEDLTVYQSFFWDLSVVDSTEVRALIKLRVSHTQFSGEDIAAQQAALAGAYWGDARKVAADLPSSPWSALVTQMRMGLMPAQVDLGLAAQSAVHVLMAKIMEAACGSGSRDAERVVAYTAALRSMREVQATLSSPEAELRKQMAALSVRTDDGKIPSITEITQGNHTTQMLPSNLLQGERGSGDEESGDDDEYGDEDPAS